MPANQMDVEGDPLPGVLRVLVVDRDPGIHHVTRVLLEGVNYAGHPLEVISAGSAKEARAVLRAESDIAVVLLDVVLERPTAGLDLVRWIRDAAGNDDVRLVLRTDEPDRVPENDVLLRYDISDTRATGDLTASPLLASLVGALRSFERIRALAHQRDHMASLTRTLEDRVTERTQALRDTERRLRSILDAPVLPIVILARADGLVLFSNDSAKQMLGLFETHHDEGIWCDADDRERLFKRLGQAGRIGDFEAQVKGGDGQRYWALISAITMTFDGTASVLLSFSDISGRKAMEDELRRLATTDPLTGVGNRRALMDVGERELRRARRYGSALSLLMIDIDHFKRVNDTHGHAIGDLALKALVRACQAQLREIDVVCRFGGEEFVVLLAETPLDAGVLVAERLRMAIGDVSVPLPERESEPGRDSEALRRDGRAVSLTVSIGVTAPRPGDQSLGELLERADAALYEAKQSGRNRVVHLA